MNDGQIGNLLFFDGQRELYNTALAIRCSDIKKPSGCRVRYPFKHVCVQWVLSQIFPSRRQVLAPPITSRILSQDAHKHTTMSLPPPAIPPALTVYTCPSRPCPVLSPTMQASLTHLRTHAAYDAVRDAFGTLGLERLIPRATLHPTTEPLEPGCVAYVCLPCGVSLPSVSSAEQHLLATPAHVGQVAAKRALSGLQGIHQLLPRMRMGSVSDAPCESAPPEAAVVSGKVTLRALLGEDDGVAITIPRTTRLDAVPGMLMRKMDGVDWYGRVAAGMEVRFASVKMHGRAAMMVVRGEMEWVRVMGDVVKGGSVEWAGAQVEEV